MESIRVYEHTLLRHEQGLPGYNERFEERHYNAMVDYHDNRGGAKYFELVRSGVKFFQYVGVLQVLDITIEILPKTDKSEDESTWHNVLLAMLRETRFLKLDYLSEASLRFRKYSILHLYFMEYLHQLQLIMKRGLVKKYRKREGNLTALKGALQFNQHVSKNLIHKERFYTRHQVYDHQHVLHQILFEALMILKRIASQSLLIDQLNRVLFEFPEMPRRSVTGPTFDQLRFDRKTKPYKKAIDIARMIILNFSPDIKGGNQDLFALLFDMNDLWEEYIYRQLLKAGGEVRFQDSQDFWGTRKMRPDMVIGSGEDMAIVDTKWKIVNDGQPSDEDLRQVFAYNIYWGAQCGFLVYPRTASSPNTNPGEYHKGGNGETKMTCQVVYLDVLKNGRLNSGVGKELTEQLQLYPPIRRPTLLPSENALYLDSELPE